MRRTWRNDVRKVFAAAIVAASLSAMSAAAEAGPIESLTALFTTADGGVTLNGYDHKVLVTVSGAGNSLGGCLNDAFYVYWGCPGAIYHDGNGAWLAYYQLSFGTSTLVPFNPDQNADNFLVGGLPDYNPSHDYSFILDTGVTIPTLLHFGVSDGEFDDNAGSYQITVSQLAIPEPVSLLLFGAGLAGALAVRRRKKAQ
jgi:hypothetical protein